MLIILFKSKNTELQPIPKKRHGNKPSSPFLLLMTLVTADVRTNIFIATLIVINLDADILFELVKYILHYAVDLIICIIELYITYSLLSG